MNMSEFYSDFLLRYQTDGVSRKISINTYCISGGCWVSQLYQMEELCKLDSSLRTLLLSEDRFLFCDETTEQVKVVNRSIGKMEYRKKYIWGIKNPDIKVAY